MLEQTCFSFVEERRKVLNSLVQTYKRKSGFISVLFFFCLFAFAIIQIQRSDEISYWATGVGSPSRKFYQ
jgi:hypothetical protein